MTIKSLCFAVVVFAVSVTAQSVVHDWMAVFVAFLLFRELSSLLCYLKFSGCLMNSVVYDTWPGFYWQLLRNGLNRITERHPNWLLDWQVSFYRPQFFGPDDMWILARVNLFIHTKIVKLNLLEVKIIFLRVNIFGGVFFATPKIVFLFCKDFPWENIFYAPINLL